MKKSLFTLAVAAAALSGCVKSQVVEVADNMAIDFDAHVDKSTKVEAVTNSSLTKFWMYCAKGETSDDLFSEDTGDHYFDAVEIQKNGNTYSYGHKLWIGYKTFRFATYSNGNEKLTSGVTFNPGPDATAWGLTFDDYTVSDKDLIAAVPSEVITENDLSSMSTVNITFDHLLSRVRFTFYVDGLTDGSYLKISEFKFNGIKTDDCTINRTSGASDHSISWSGTGTKDDYVFSAVDAATATQAYECFVIPQSNQSIVVDKLTVQTYDHSHNLLDTKVYEDIDMKITETGHTSWQPGIIYSYMATLSGASNQIHFSASVEGWSDPDAADKNLTLN